jgi:acyl dehydratase
MSDSAPDWAALSPGSPGPSASYGPFTHAAFIRYAGALGEYNDLHQDVTVAHAAGYPDVFAQGMFIGGLVAQRLWLWLGDRGRLRRFRPRIVAPTFRGESLSFTSVVTGVATGAQPSAELEATVSKDSGTVVLRALATIEWAVTAELR